MAFYLEKERTTSTPYVMIDEEIGLMKLEGRCFHEKVIDFFKEVNDWLNGYLESDFEVFTLACGLEYINSSTTKLLHNMLLKMDKFAKNEKRIIINWITTEDNEIMMECGEDFRDEMENLEFNLVIKDKSS